MQLGQQIYAVMDFTFNRFFMKLFKTSNMEIVNYCQRLFGCDLPSTLLKQRFEKFITTFNQSINQYVFSAPSTQVRADEALQMSSQYTYS